LELHRKLKLVAYADDLVYKKVNIIYKNMGILLKSCREIGLQINTNISVCMFFWNQNTGHTMCDYEASSNFIASTSGTS